MHILQVIHGYPPEYNAGSENYTQTIVQELISRGHKVSVFSRTENPFAAEYEMSTIKTEDSILSRYTINMARTKDRFISAGLDSIFEKLLAELNPDIVHFQHLNHLSLSLPKIVHNHGIPSVYTLHDFWLMCPMGQFLQMNLQGEPWKQCDGQEDMKCAKFCYSRYHTGSYEATGDEKYWTEWIHKRMLATIEAIDNIDQFISPSKTVLNSFISSFGNKDKVFYLDYGFDLKKFSGRSRKQEGCVFVFGYIGTHIPGKGIKMLIEAFSHLTGDPILRIWGREKSEYTPSLRKYADSFGAELANRLEWMGEFNGEKIVDEVFNNLDCIVVPSIWLENSPLVIHEAQQARVPVITADVGGMAEYVVDGKNGLLFHFRDADSLASKMQSIIDRPGIAAQLGKTGYLYSSNGDIQSVSFHVDNLLQIFSTLIMRKS